MIEDLLVTDPVVARYANQSVRAPGIVEIIETWRGTTVSGVTMWASSPVGFICIRPRPGLIVSGTLKTKFTMLQIPAQTSGVLPKLLNFWASMGTPAVSANWPFWGEK